MPGRYTIGRKLRGTFVSDAVRYSTSTVNV
jgi:hypothetical protein